VRVDIIIPAHNEQHRIAQTLDEYTSRLSDPEYRFVVAMDDCSDDTPTLVSRRQQADARVRTASYPRLGKGGVLAESFRRSDAEYVAFVDADGATPPDELLRLIESCDGTGSDVAIASRYHPSAVLPVRRTRLRALVGRLFAGIVRRLFRVPYFDTQCGAKVLRHSAAERVTPLVSSRDFVFDVDLLIAARAVGLRVAEVPTVWLDRDGSRLSTGRDSRRMAASLGLLWLRQRIVPFHLPHAEVVGPRAAEDEAAGGDHVAA
jgi:glycosyltransferase involved in cell wall biosynthesis